MVLVAAAAAVAVAASRDYKRLQSHALTEASSLSDSNSPNNHEGASLIVWKEPTKVALETCQEVKLRAQVVQRATYLLLRSALVLSQYKWFYTVYGQEEPESSDDNDEHDYRNRNNSWIILNPSEYQEQLSSVHQRAASLLYATCASHGGLLIKVGQYLANSTGFIPTEYAQTLAPLQDSCAPLPYHEVVTSIKTQLQYLGYSNISQVFAKIEEKPLGSASLAQVHKALLVNGQEVAVKVQRPSVEASTKADLVALEVLSWTVEKMFPGAGFAWMLPEFHETIAAELDFTQEQINMQRARHMLQGRRLSTMDLSSLLSSFSRRRRRLLDVHQGGGGGPRAIVPVPLQELTTKKMLVMSYESGFRITDTTQLKRYNMNPTKVAAATCALFAELMFIHGFVHADPHPGNLLVRPRTTIEKEDGSDGEFDLVLLDHGMYRRLDENFRMAHGKVWAGLVAGDEELAKQGVVELGLAPEKYLDALGLMLVYRIPSKFLDSNLRGKLQLGATLDKSSRKELRQRIHQHYKHTNNNNSNNKKQGGEENPFTPSKANAFLETLPRDLLFCLRCTGLVRGINLELGGTSAQRMVAFGTAASRGVRLVPPKKFHKEGLGVADDGSGGVHASQDAEHLLESKQVELHPPSTESKLPFTSSSGEALEKAKKALNQPVTSELIAQAKLASTFSAATYGKTVLLQSLPTKTTTYTMAPSTLSDFMVSIRMSWRVWTRSLWIDFWVWLTCAARGQKRITTKQFG